MSCTTHVVGFQPSTSCFACKLVISSGPANTAHASVYQDVDTGRHIFCSSDLLRDRTALELALHSRTILESGACFVFHHTRNRVECPESRLHLWIEGQCCIHPADVDEKSEFREIDCEGGSALSHLISQIASRLRRVGQAIKIQLCECPCTRR